MRSRQPTSLVPAHDDQVFPHQSYPPWLALARVFRTLADVLARHAPTATLRPVEVRLFQAARQIMELARGGLSPAQWHRRVCVAVDRLEQARGVVGACLVAGHLPPDEARLLVHELDDTIARLGEAAARMPLPDGLLGDA